MTETELKEYGFSEIKDFKDGLWLELPIIAIPKSWLQSEVKLTLRYYNGQMELWNNAFVCNLFISDIGQIKGLYAIFTNTFKA